MGTTPRQTTDHKLSYLLPMCSEGPLIFPKEAGIFPPFMQMVFKPEFPTPRGVLHSSSVSLVYIYMIYTC